MLEKSVGLWTCDPESREMGQMRLISQISSLCLFNCFCSVHWVLFSVSFGFFFHEMQQHHPKKVIFQLLFFFGCFSSLSLLLIYEKLIVVIIEKVSSPNSAVWQFGKNMKHRIVVFMGVLFCGRCWISEGMDLFLDIFFFG